MGRLYRLAYLVLITVGALFALNFILIRLTGTVQQQAAANFMASVDHVLGAWGVIPPFVSWAVLGFLVFAMIYFAIWEAHRINASKTRWFLLIFPCLVLAVGPIAWPFLEVRAMRPSLLYQRDAGPRPGEARSVLGIEFVWIPPGRFLMGSPATEPGHEDDERQHVVTLRYGFWMGSREITRGQWDALMGTDPSRPPNEVDMPVTGVSWQDCQEFLAKLNASAGGSFRLPTEAEWEYACRALTTGAYSFDSGAAELGEYGWYIGNSDKKTHPVGLKTPNAWGLYDIYGNVWEWCQDWYGTYPSGPTVDPTGPASGMYHVIRGGAWNSPPEDCRSASRSFFMEGYFLDKSVLGFRIVRGPALRGAPVNTMPRPGARGIQIPRVRTRPNANTPAPNVPMPVAPQAPPGSQPGR